jgi:hypothetical protein
VLSHNDAVRQLQKDDPEVGATQVQCKEQTFLWAKKDHKFVPTAVGQQYQKSLSTLQNRDPSPGAGVKQHTNCFFEKTRFEQTS